MLLSGGGDWNSLLLVLVGGLGLCADTAFVEVNVYAGDVSMDALLLAGDVAPVSDLVGVAELWLELLSSPELA